MAHKVKKINNKKPKAPKIKQASLTNPFEKFPVKPVDKGYVSIVKESVQLSNQYGSLVQQYVQKQQEYTMRKNYIKNLKKGEIKTPLMIKTVDGLFQPIYDIKKLVKQLENKNKMVNQGLLLVEDQVSHWYDEYRDSLIRVSKHLESVLGDDKNVHGISGYRKFNASQKKQEEKLFEKDYDKLTDKDIKTLKTYANKNSKR
ncbi:hypothetical protein KAX02_07425 [candidate division WOR-3 bacterium]|nr:hypothetical protein [candidate division WOR-3 bacterium]